MENTQVMNLMTKDPVWNFLRPLLEYDGGILSKYPYQGHKTTLMDLEATPPRWMRPGKRGGASANLQDLEATPPRWMRPGNHGDTLANLQDLEARPPRWMRPPTLGKSSILILL